MKNIILLLILSTSLYAVSPFKSPVIIISSPFLATTGYGGERRNNLHQGSDSYSENYYPVITPIMDGVVIEIGIDVIYGKYVIIKHANNYYSMYAHGKTIYYSASGTVDINTPIMLIGSTGYSDSPHLHTEVWQVVDDKIIYYDPVQWFDGEIKYIKSEVIQNEIRR